VIAAEQADDKKAGHGGWARAGINAAAAPPTHSPHRLQLTPFDERPTVQEKNTTHGTTVASVSLSHDNAELIAPTCDGNRQK